MESKRMLHMVKTGTVCLSMCFLAGCGDINTQKEKEVLVPQKPTTITVWNYYTGAQLDAFDAHVAEFNETKGKELGIIVTASSEGSVANLENNVIAAAKKEVGAKDVPNIFAAYADTAYKIDQMGLVVDLDSYFTEEEKDGYLEGYLKEGDLDGKGSLKIFPIAKSTEIFMLNTTDWDKFSQETGASMDELKTIEGVTEVAEAYYEWSGGKAFFGRDAMANYLLTGARQLGTEMISIDKDGNAVLDFPEDVVRKLWDYYYVPYIKGYFSSVGRFRSDDVKIGEIISFVGSSTSVSFFPKQVVGDSAEPYDITYTVLEAPKFDGAEDYATQQGAGMVVTKGSEAEIQASVEFLKWFTETERNIVFADSSGYLPVKKEANKIEVIREFLKGNADGNVGLEVSLNTVNSNMLYTPPATENGNAVRSILEYSMSDKALADRTAIEEMIGGGMSEEEAVAAYDTDENFKDWYVVTKAELEELFKE